MAARFFALSALLLASAFAGRLDKVARNKGFHPNAIRDLKAHSVLASRGAGHHAQTERKYYNEDSASTYLPFLPITFSR